VLQNFTPDEELFFSPLRDRVVDAVLCWLFEGVVSAMNRYNG
jgi:hypothetical protein